MDRFHGEINFRRFMLFYAPADGDSVGDFVGDSVRDFVGDSVGDFVGDTVGDVVGDAVGDEEGGKNRKDKGSEKIPEKASNEVVPNKRKIEGVVPSEKKVFWYLLLPFHSYG